MLTASYNIGGFFIMKGFTKIQNELLFDANLDPMAKVVYAGLSYYDRGRGCFCKRETMARLLNVSIYQLRKALKVLEAEGYIVIHKRYNGCTDIIKRVADNKTLEADENCKPNTIREENKVEEEVASTSEDVIETTTDPAPRLTPEAVEDTPIDKDATEACHRRIQTLLGYARWEQWFSDAWVIEETPLALKLHIPKPYVADYINKAFRQKIENEVGKELVIVGVMAKVNA